MDYFTISEMKAQIENQRFKEKTMDGVYEIRYKYYKKMTTFNTLVNKKLYPSNFLFKSEPEPSIPKDLKSFRFKTIGWLMDRRKVRQVILFVTKGDINK